MSLQTRDTLTTETRTYELFVDDEPTRGPLHFGCVEVCTKAGDFVANIGVWWQGGALVDYDGISGWITPNVKRLLQRNRIRVSSDFTNDA